MSPLFERLAPAKPLEQWRQKGRWPASFDQIWEELIIRNGRQNGTRRMIELLRLGKTQGHEKLRGAVESALELGSCDVATVQYLITAGQLDRAVVEPLEFGALSSHVRFDQSPKGIVVAINLAASVPALLNTLIRPERA